jgi:hypothetical protein
MKKYPVAWFYILAFGISWLRMISIVLGSRGITPFDSPYFQFLSIFYAVGPALAAVIVSQVTHGKTGIRELLKGLIRWRVGTIYNWGVSCRIRSPELRCGDRSDRSIWKSASLSPPEGLCGLKWGCN